jgi:hypothetical protein
MLQFDYRNLVNITFCCDATKAYIQQCNWSDPCIGIYGQLDFNKPQYRVLSRDGTKSSFLCIFLSCETSRVGDFLHVNIVFCDFD